MGKQQPFDGKDIEYDLFATVALTLAILVSIPFYSITVFIGLKKPPSFKRFKTHRQLNFTFKWFKNTLGAYLLYEANIKGLFAPSPL